MSTDTTPTIRAALIDLSGTLHIGDNAIPGAVQAMQRLRDRNIPTLLLTNTTKVSSQTLYTQLQDIGFSCTIPSPDCVMTSTMACITFLKQPQQDDGQELRPYCLLESVEDFEHAGIPLEPPHNAVVVGLAPSKFDYENLNTAFHILSTTTVKQPLIAIHKGMYYRDSNQQLSLGPGGFVACLEQASSQKAILIGKPNPSFYQAALQQLGFENGMDVCMVGDDVVGDVCGAHEAGIGMTILVQTGKYQDGDESKAPEGSGTVPSIVEAVDYILQHAKSED